MVRSLENCLEVKGGGEEEEATHWWDKYALWATIFGRAGIPLYAWSTLLIDTAVAAVLIETFVLWYLVLDFINKKIRKDFDIHKKGLTSKAIKIIIIILGLVGLAFVNLSRGGNIGNFFNWGVIMALSGAILNAVMVDRSIYFGQKTSKEQLKQDDQDNSVLIYTIACLVISGLFVFIVGAILWGLLIFFGHSPVITNFPSDIFWLVLIGGIVSPISAIYASKGNITRRGDFVEINAISFTSPVLALILLLSFTSIEISRFDFFYMGTVMVFATNMLLQAESKHTGWGLKGLVLSLWVAGVFIHLRDSLWKSGFISDWLWNDSTDYFALLGLSATIFILVLSFTRLRLSDLIHEEEKLALDIFWKFGLLKKYSMSDINDILDTPPVDIKDMDRKILSDIVEIDQLTPGKKLEGGKTLENKKKELKKSILRSDIRSDINEPESAEIMIQKAEIMTQLDLLTVSKAKGRDVVETLILVAFAMLTITIALGTRPYFEGWNGYLFDIFSVLFVSAIAFLTINFFDLQGQRGMSVFKDDSFQRKIWNDVILPILLCIIIVGVFIVLLYGKWFSDWSWASEVAPVLEPSPPPQ